MGSAHSISPEEIETILVHQTNTELKRKYKEMHEIERKEKFVQEKVLELRKQEELVNEKEKILTDMLKLNTFSIKDQITVEYGIRVTEDFDLVQQTIDATQKSLEHTSKTLKQLEANFQKKLYHIEHERDELFRKLVEQTNINVTSMETFSQQINNYQVQIIELKKEMEDTKHKYENQISNLIIKNNDNNVSVNILLKQKEELTQRIERTISEHGENIAKKESQLADLAAKLKQKEDELHAKHDDFFTKTERMQQSIIEISLRSETKEKDLLVQIEELKRMRDDLKQEILQLQNKSTELETKMRLETNNLLEKISAITISKEETEKTLSVATEKLQTIAAEYETKIVDLQKSVTTMTKTVEEMDAKLKSNADAMKTLSEQNGKLDMVAKILIREVDTYTNHRNILRIVRTKEMGEAERNTAEEKRIFDLYVKVKQGEPLTIGELMRLLLSFNIMLGVDASLFLTIFEDSKRAVIGYIETLCAYKDIYAMFQSFASLYGNGSTTRKELKQIFEKAGLRFQLNDFNSIMAAVDDSMDEEISRSEFMKMCLYLIVLRIMFATCDINSNSSVSRIELQLMLNTFNVGDELVRKFSNEFENHLPEADQSLSEKDQYLNYEGFAGLTLFCIKNYKPKKK